MRAVSWLADGDSTRQWIVASIADARDVLETVLTELLDAPVNDEEPEHPTMAFRPQD